MSRRRSRLPPPVSSDRELTVDEFLKGVITTELYVLLFLLLINFAQLAIRTPRTPRNKRISAYRTPIVEEADFILETLAAVEREEKLQKESIGKSFAKNLKNRYPKRVSSEDSECDSLTTKGKSSTPPKKRRKHYVVLNSLPLSQDLRNDRFQFTQLEVRVSFP